MDLRVVPQSEITGFARCVGSKARVFSVTSEQTYSLLS